ncbi:TPA: hypothetical protein PI730_002816 [Staphylococcus aureus]|nr:hypothetical protein [Staphylococcus aureus]HDH6143214.1 hypothetical protein [Staphylococcus aureus]
MIAFTLMALIILGIWYSNHKNTIKNKEHIQKTINEVDAQMSKEFKVTDINSIGQDSENNDVIIFDNGHSLHLTASQILFVEYEKDEDIYYHMPYMESVYEDIKQNKSTFSEEYVLDKVASSVTLKILRSRYDELKR